MKVSLATSCLGLYLLIAISAITSAGWMHADEHARVVEAAAYVVRGFASLPWEFDVPLVSMLLGVIHAPVLWLADHLLGLEAPGQAAALRLFSGLVNGSRILAFYLLLKLWLPKVVPGGEKMGPALTRKAEAYTLLFALTPFALPFFVRTCQENWAGSAMLWALVLYEYRPAGSRRHIALAAFGLGFLLALAVSLRLQIGFSVAALGLYLAFTRPWRESASALAGLVAGLIPLAVVDWYYTGLPFKPAWNYLRYALGNEEGGELWGSSPWYFYGLSYATAWFPPLGLLLLPSLWRGLKTIRSLGLVFLPFLLIHVVLGHKENRYFSPMFPLMALATIVGWELYRQRLGKGSLPALGRSSLMAYGALTLLASLILTLAVQNPSPRMYHELARMKERGQLTSNFVYAADSRSNVALFYYPYPEALPPKISLGEFMAKLPSLPSGEPRHYGIYRMDIDDFAQVENICRVDFVSVTPFYRSFLRTFAPVLKKKDLDAIVLCP